MGVGFEIEIKLEDVRLIMGEQFEPVFEQFIQGANCTACRRFGDATIAIKSIWLNPIGDITIEGWCKDCGERISRYLETGADPNSYDQAMAIREFKMDIQKDYNWRLP